MIVTFNPPNFTSVDIWLGIADAILSLYHLMTGKKSEASTWSKSVEDMSMLNRETKALQHRSCLRVDPSQLVKGSLQELEVMILRIPPTYIK